MSPVEQENQQITSQIKFLKSTIKEDKQDLYKLQSILKSKETIEDTHDNTIKALMKKHKEALTEQQRSNNHFIYTCQQEFLHERRQTQLLRTQIKELENEIKEMKSNGNSIFKVCFLECVRDKTAFTKLCVEICVEIFLKMRVFKCAC